MSRRGIVNVRMVITEEKILSNIDKVQKLINPKSKKQIVQLEDDVYFKDLIESVKTYLIEYPKKKNFPSSVYRAAYGLVEFATNQFEENTKKIEELIRQREQNISAASKLKELLEATQTKERDWKDQVREATEEFTEDIVETLMIVGRAKDEDTEEYQDAVKLLNARINNLESNLHIEIDMERIEDRSKALSYIGIEIADALKTIPTPVDITSESLENSTNVATATVTNTKESPVTNTNKVTITEENEPILTQSEAEQYTEDTTFEAKPGLWQRFKNSKFVKAIKAITRIRIVFDYSEALPEGRGENNK